MTAHKTYLRVLRHSVQIGFLLLTILIGLQFYHFVRHFESAGYPSVQRPPSVDAFLPIGGLMAVKYFLLTGIIDPVHPSGFVMFVAIVGVSLLVKKGFCGWICPIGTISQYAWMAGEKVSGKIHTFGKFTDLSLRSLKYILLSLFALLIGVAMAPNMMLLFFITDYYKVVDVRMMKFFTEMSTLTFCVLVALVALSFLYKNFWCRYLCPYGALLGLVSRFSPLKIRRNEGKCTHCHACTQHCPTLIDVESQEVVKSAECFGCLTCVSHCPSDGALDLELRAGRREITMKPWLFPVVLIILFYLIIGLGLVTDNWHSKIPSEEYGRLIPEIQKDFGK